METNIQGDVIAIYDINGTKLVEYFYDAWGNILDTNVYTGGTEIATLNPFRYRGYYYDAETGWYYLNSRYYNPEWGRFINCDGYVSTGQELLGYNMFAYCNNNPVNFSSTTGQRTSITKLDVKIISCVVESRNAFPEAISVETISIVKYDVPLYDQGNLSLCWAYCQTMVEDYQNGVVRTQEEADIRAREIAISVHGENNWNKVGWPTNCGVGVKADGIISLYFLLQDGPVYGYYWRGIKGSGAHLIVVVGVDLTTGMIYTNNPWGYSGKQTYEEFLNGCLGAPDDYNMPLNSLIKVN